MRPCQNFGNLEHHIIGVTGCNTSWDTNFGQELDHFVVNFSNSEERSRQTKDYVRRMWHISIHSQSVLALWFPMAWGWVRPSSKSFVGKFLWTFQNNLVFCPWDQKSWYEWLHSSNSAYLCSNEHILLCIYLIRILIYSLSRAWE